MKRYNSSAEILPQNGHQMFIDLTSEKASDVSSSIYTINIAFSETSVGGLSIDDLRVFLFNLWVG